MDINIKKGFVKPPLSEKEKEKLEKKFLEGANPEAQEEPMEELLEKLKTKTIIIRAPISYHQNLIKIRKITGMTINAVCLELLWPAIKQKLKDLGIT
jgi:hypothetical protein